jgi:hypothetical protein
MFNITFSWFPQKRKIKVLLHTQLNREQKVPPARNFIWVSLLHSQAKDFTFPFILCLRIQQSAH